MISCYSLGAVNEVTGSKHIIEINGKQYMIDCGAWQGTDGADIKNREFHFFEADKLKEVFLTHAHYDHCGLLPLLYSSCGYTGKIHSTPATRDLASIVMLDSSKIQKYEKGGPIYSEKDVIDTIGNFLCHFYGQTKMINEDLKVTFYDAGHILGSAMVDLAIRKKPNFIKKLFMKNNNNKTTDDDIHVLYTGDLGRDSNPITKKPATNMPAPNYIFMESTYGNRLHESEEHIIGELGHVINKTISRGGKVIIPSFAIERAQELIYYIKTLMRQNIIPHIPVYVDSPMANNATGVFNIHSECFNDKIVEDFISRGKNPFSVRTLRCITDYQESIFVAENDEPSIIIAANGMCEAGRIINHLKFGGLENEKNTILIVGYMGEGTLGRKILEGEPKVIIDKKEYDVKAEIHKINAFSAHADYSEILKWLQSIDTSKLKTIFLVHGDKEAQTSLKDYLTVNGTYHVEIVEPGKVYDL